MSYSISPNSNCSFDFKLNLSSLVNLLILQCLKKLTLTIRMLMKNGSLFSIRKSSIQSIPNSETSRLAHISRKWKHCLIRSCIFVNYFFIFKLKFFGWFSRLRINIMALIPMIRIHHYLYPFDIYPIVVRIQRNRRECLMTRFACYTSECFPLN